MKVVAIVEGDGEVAAVPLLLRRIAAWRTPGIYPDIPHPIRVRRDRFLNREAECDRYLQLAAGKCGVGDWIFVLLDADQDCPAQVAAQVLESARKCIGHRSVSVVVAKREFEAWFVAAARSLAGHRGFTSNPVVGVEPEGLGDAKGWIRFQIEGGVYGETTDQPAFTALFDLQQAFDGSSSFRKLCREWDRQTSGA